MSRTDRPLRWLAGVIATPPLSTTARLAAGFLLRRLQMGERLEMPMSRPMPVLGPRCHELRVRDEDKTWRIILDVFAKKGRRTPRRIIALCRKRLAEYDRG